MYKEYFEYNTELEDVIIGACIIEHSAFANIKGLINAEMIYDGFNRFVFYIIEQMFDSSKPIDLVTVVQECYNNNSDFKDIAHTISIKTNKVASTANIIYHCLVLRELYIKRLLIQIKQSVNVEGDIIENVLEIENKLKSARDLKVSNDWESFKEILINIKLNLETPQEQGVKIGISEFDKISGGLQKKEVMVIGARPSVGKTALACQIALNIAGSGKKVAIISLEMDNAKLSKRIISQLSGVEYWKIDRGLFSNNYEIESVNNAIDNNYNLPIFFSEKTDVSVSDIRAKALKSKYANNIDILFIDYLGLIQPEKAGTREQEVSKISRGLKLLAMELDIPIVVLAQLNRAVEMREKSAKPKLSDLRDSGSIEQDADIVAFIHSDFKSGIVQDINGNSTETQRDFIVAKYRNGFTKEIKLGWNGEQMLFINEPEYVHYKELQQDTESIF